MITEYSNTSVEVMDLKIGETFLDSKEIFMVIDTKTIETELYVEAVSLIDGTKTLFPLDTKVNKVGIEYKIIIFKESTD